MVVRVTMRDVIVGRMIMSGMGMAVSVTARVGMALGVSVALRMGVSAAGIGAAFGIERRLDLDHARA